MKSKIIWMALIFIAGILGGYLISRMCCNKCDQKCCKTELSSGTQAAAMMSRITRIDTIMAKSFFRLYHAHPDTICGLKGFTINMDQYQAMKMILDADSTNSVHGFRFYLGADKSSSNRILMVVGTGSPDKTGTIYSTSAAGAGPCPLVCDSDSPITRD